MRKIFSASNFPDLPQIESASRPVTGTVRVGRVLSAYQKDKKKLKT